VERVRRGRYEEAARNDQRILDAAREVLVERPDAPIAAVAQAAGVGISALYSRYQNKDGLLRALATDALERYVVIHERALAARGDAWTIYVTALGELLDSGSQALAQRLAGTFVPTAAMGELAVHAGRLSQRLFDRTKRAGAFRAGLTVDDVTLLLELLSAVRMPGPDDGRALRDRYFTVITEALRADQPRMPGAPPAKGALADRWRR
jgi:AcrR family transcriptional regulator